jgi:hypothetical protein
MKKASGKKHPAQHNHAQQPAQALPAQLIGLYRQCLYS